MKLKCFGDGMNRVGTVKRQVAVNQVRRVYQGSDGRNKEEK